MTRLPAVTKPITVRCRACLTQVRLAEEPVLFDIFSCPECKQAFEVIGLSPIRLDWSSEYLDDDGWSGPGFDNAW